MKLIEINFYVHNECNSPSELLDIYRPSSGFVAYIKNKIEIQRIHHIGSQHDLQINGVRHLFFKSKNRPWHIPIKTILHVQTESPNVILIHGIVFQIQVIVLRLFLKKNIKIICQHHGEPPTKGIRRFFQKITDYFIDAYLFTASEITDEWIADKQIKSKDKCFEVLEASVELKRRDKTASKRKLNLHGQSNYLWVGRLIDVKDPFTILKGFELHVAKNPEANLYMIYQRDDLLLKIEKIIEESYLLKRRVHLIGFIPQNELEYWYSACDFYISGSKKEGSGYALLEAMSCGCIPVVTNIPSFKKITEGGKFGRLFEVGNKNALAEIMEAVEGVDRQAYSEMIVHHFNENLTYKNIAEDIYSVCLRITKRAS